MSLLCCVDWWLCCFGWPPHKFISWIWIAALFFAFALLKFHSSISNAAKGPTARQLFLYFFSSPIRKSELERNKESWMGWASHQSVHLPQIQIKLTHRFVFVYNSWLAAYTVIILFFNSIPFNSTTEWNEIKEKKVYFLLFDEWNGWLNWLFIAPSIKKCFISLINGWLVIGFQPNKPNQSTPFIHPSLPLSPLIQFL